MPNRVLHPNPFGPIDQILLDDIQRKIGKVLPTDYVKYLQEYNGGNFEKAIFLSEDGTDDGDLHHMFGIHSGPEYLRFQDRYALRNWFDLEFLGDNLNDFAVFARTSNGDPILLNLKDGAVYCFVADDMAGDTYDDFLLALKRIASSFDSFTMNLMNIDELKNRVLDDAERKEFEKRLEEFKRQREEDL